MPATGTKHPEGQEKGIWESLLDYTWQQHPVKIGACQVIHTD